ncbi:MAG: hypothetical protein EXR11_13315 [Rhodospirillaceae bacterium]|nr:hypothetical protein [Rhodospirillaceae bacterium]
MLKPYLPVLISFGLALLIGASIRLAGGPERGARLAALGLVLGILAGLSAIAGFSWSAAGPFNRIGHIVVGAAVVGVLLDTLKPGPLLRWGLLAAFALGCGWASAIDGLFVKAIPPLWQLGLAAGLSALLLGFIVRLGIITSHKPTALTVAAVLAAGLAVLAAIAGDQVLMLAALAVTAAIIALSVVSGFLVIDIANVAVVPMAAAIVALAWAFSQREPDAAMGLAVLALALFAERTARRVPMPGGRISDYLYIAVLAGCCAIPVAIAAVLTAARV